MQCRIIDIGDQSDNFEPLPADRNLISHFDSDIVCMHTVNCDLIRFFRKCSVKQAGKIVFVHADLIEGLTARDITADFIAQNTKADGIISTRPNIIRRAKALGMLTIQRFFLFDSLSFDTVLRQSSNADAVDLLPGTMPRVLERLKPQIRQPIIASGLLSDKQDVVAALSAGAQAVSTTKPELWEI